MAANDVTHIGVTLSNLRDPLEIVRFVSIGLEDVKQLGRKQMVSQLLVIHFLIFNLIVFGEIIITTQRKYNDTKKI